MYNALPKNERTFHIDAIGDVTNIAYKGDFTVKCVLDMKGKHALELEKTRLMADYANPTGGLAGIAITLSSLRAKIVKGPDWWEQSNAGADLIDENIILKLYDECNRLEAEWRKELKKQSEGTQSGNAPKES